MLAEGVDTFVRMRKLRIATWTEEADAMDTVAALMRSGGWDDTGQLVDAVNRGEVRFSEEQIEALLRW
ncbi:MAG: hypothetical protein ABR509_00190 [Candidatus Limnocylindria bacterium]